MKRSMEMDQEENIDLHSIKTVFHGSKQLKMKMERPSRPTRPSGVIARWFLPYPHSQYMRPFTSAAARHCPLNPSPPPAPLLTKPVWLSKVLDIHIPPPPSFYTNYLGLKATSILVSLRNIATGPTLNISCFKCKKY